MPISPGQSLLQYRLIEKVGTGGMGEVWRAVDMRLGRNVAVKVLPESLAQDQAALARFDREARAVASLSHPNVLALYDVGHVEGVAYLVTELLEGATLRDRLAAPLDVETAVGYAQQIARGLAAAHDRGLVHRDLKPENIFVTDDGHVKILDFGLARLEPRPEAEPSKLADAATIVASPTIPGTLLGTPGYMAPEQVLGEVADRRSDVFSFGAVLFEMLTGRPAFTGSSSADRIRAVLQQEADYQLVLSAALIDVIRKCLAKDPDQRWQSASEVNQALGNASVNLPASELAPSIAVLPFADMSQAGDQAYFCEGIAEEILTALCGINGLRVVARTSSQQFKGMAEDVRRIGRALSVANILEGSVRLVGRQLRVTAQLVDVATGYRVWSERYDRELAEVFAIQDEIAHAVAEALAVQFSTPPINSARQHSPDLRAYRLFLKGRHERYTSRNFNEALRNFEAAIELDPQYARAHIGAAETSMLLGNTGVVRPRLAFARVETELSYAAALEGQTAETLAVECFLRAFEWNWGRAEEAGRHAIQIDPSLVFARSWLSMVLSARGRCEEAVAMAQSVVTVDPLSHFGWAMAGWALNAGRRFKEAELLLRRALEMDSGSSVVLWNLGIALVAEGRPVDALTLFERAQEIERGSSLMTGFVAWGLAAAGKKEAARGQLTELEALSRYRHVPRYPLAWTLAALGENEAALDQYERALGEREPFLIFPLFPGNDPFRREPRFRAALEQMGLTWALSNPTST